MFGNGQRKSKFLLILSVYDGCVNSLGSGGFISSEAADSQTSEFSVSTCKVTVFTLLVENLIKLQLF